MDSETNKILIWLPSPMGDAIMSTPALRAIRRRFESANIVFFAKPVICQVLSPSDFNDFWLEQTTDNPFKIAQLFRREGFTHAILFKNSFGSALATFLARIPVRIGYIREKRGLLLTEKLYPPKTPDGKYLPHSMIDYYLAIASRLGCQADNKAIELTVSDMDIEDLYTKMPETQTLDNPIVILVPGGAFGPSKCWPTRNFTETADYLIEKHNATVVVSVSLDPAERAIAGQICHRSRYSPVNLGENPLSLGELKALFSMADLVITNDTGPRHIAIALKQKTITLFGPNNPQWTDTGYEDEVKIVGKAPCVPCDKPECTMEKHLCMDSITVEMVCNAADKQLTAS